MNVAVAAGHVEIAQWLLENDNEEWSVTSVADAAANADLRIIQWLHEHFHDLFDCKVMDEAAGGGHLDVVRWLHQNRSEGCSCGAMDLAAKNGHLDVVQWLHDNRKEGCTAMALLDAAANGHLDVVKFLVVNERETTWTLNAFEEAVLRGQLHVVKWLHDYCKARCSTDTITVSAWMGYLDTVCYLSEKDRKLSESIPGLHEAATQGNMEVLAFLMNHEFGEDKRIDNLEIYAFGVFEAAWVSNHFNTVLNQFRDQQKRVYSVKRIVEFLERFHADGFHVCVCIMLGLALQRGCIAMAKRFFDRRTNQEMAAYMVTAGESQGFYAKSIDVMLRWLIDNRVSLNISNDRNLVLECCVLHEDIAARFSESDRVVLIGEVIKDNEFLQFDLGLWILENTSFKEETIRVAIRATIRQSSRFSQWLTLRLTNEEVRNWCLSDT
ncbi:hypothetical protein PHMEG_0004100 [Phytophthora megakarya]|uniref:Uncharacterized protein n=1 Tax=Phytophthora megakarya TaxID=4795 RepID=A0A225WUS6_9STRA|nr:hypothetical protein PHMEG_0004100 [Phytophthora megakarya]